MEVFRIINTVKKTKRQVSWFRNQDGNSKALRGRNQIEKLVNNPKNTK